MGEIGVNCCGCGCGVEGGGCGLCFCCPRSLRVRVKIIAIIFLIICLIHVITMGAGPQEMQFGTSYIYGIVIQLLFMISCILLYVSAINGVAWYALPWLCFAFINLILYIVAFFAFFVALITGGVANDKRVHFAGGIVSFLISFILLIWATCTVWSFFRALRRGDTVDYQAIDGEDRSRSRPRSARPVDSLKRFQKPYETESDQ